jgi:hypothetical protein
MRESWNPLGGLLAVKAVAVLLAVYCVLGSRDALHKKVNLFFAALVAYNVVALIIAAPILHQ